MGVSSRKDEYCVSFAPLVCDMICKKDPESWIHVLLPCSVAVSLWRRLFREIQVIWDNPNSCVALLSEMYKLFRGKQKGQVLRRGPVLAIFSVVWIGQEWDEIWGSKGWRGGCLVAKVRFWFRSGHWHFLSLDFILFK